MSVAFDTLKAARRLSDAGFTDEQAETLVGTFAEGITENLATKDDIALVRKDVDLVRKDLEALETKLDASVGALDKKIDASIELLETKIESSAKSTIIWLGGIMFALAVALGVIERLLPPPG